LTCKDEESKSNIEGRLEVGKHKQLLVVRVVCFVSIKKELGENHKKAKVRDDCRDNPSLAKSIHDHY